MSTLAGMLEAPGLVIAAWSVVLSLWVTTLAALSLAAWRIASRRATAQAQYRAAVLSLSMAVALSLGIPGVILAVATRPPAATATARAPAASPSEPLTPASRGTVAPQDAAVEAGASSPAPFRRWALSVPAAGLGSLGLLWVVGVAVGLVRLLGGWILASRLGARATPIVDGTVSEAFARIKGHAAVEHVQLARSPDVEAPVAIGVLSPKVVVPEHLVEHLPPDSLAPILAHELAHVARHDYAANLAQCVVEILLFHSPAIWWIGRRTREAREFCCDDRAVAFAGDRARYVEALTLVARLGALTGTRPVLGMAGPRLITRVRRLLEGEPIMDRPIAHAAGILTAAALLTLAMPVPFRSASTYVSTRVYAASALQNTPHVPRGFPQRQEGSPVRIVRAESTDTHVCGTYEIENLTSVPIAEVRFVGVLSFAPGGDRPVQIVESDWIMTTIAPGAIARLDVGLIDIEMARREGAGAHVQAFCALRDVVHENRITWSVTPNPAATTDTEALGLRRPALPRAFVGQTSAVVYPRVTLCLDEQRAEYSPGAQLAIREEPGKAARCTREGQWIEVHAATGEPLTERVDARGDQVALEITVAGLASTLAVKGAFDTAATVQLPNGQTWGFVSVRRDGGVVAVTLHDLSTLPHRLISTRSLAAGQSATFSEVEPTLSVRLAER